MLTQHLNTPTPRLGRALPLCALLAAACSGSGEDAPGSGVEAGPAFLLGTRVWTDTTTTSYFHVASDLERGTTVDAGEAVEVPGSARIFSAFDLGWFAIGDGESPTITRYVVDAEGRLAPDESISLQPYGVLDLWDTLYFASATKAYYPDRAGTQLVVWNPSTMEVTGSVPLPDTVRAGYLANYGYAPIERDGKLLISVGWFDWDETDSVLGETGLVVLDTATDSVVRVDVDDRCGGVTQPVTAASGDTYLVSSALAGAAFELGRAPTEPCVLRVPSGSDTFDPDYLVRLGELTSGALAGEPVPAGGDEVFLRVFDRSLASETAPAATWELTAQPAWQWWRWNHATGAASPVTELSASTADVVWFDVEGRVYGAQTPDDYSETTLFELTAEGGPRRALTVPGFLHGVARIR